VGIFGAGAVRFGAGDSAWVAAYIDGTFPPPARAGGTQPDITRGYFGNADMADPIISPALHPDVVARFPPTLIITGTRAMDMSPAIHTNSQLLKAGVRSTLIVGEGMGDPGEHVLVGLAGQQVAVFQSGLAEVGEKIVARTVDLNLGHQSKLRLLEAPNLGPILQSTDRFLRFANHHLEPRTCPKRLT